MYTNRNKTKIQGKTAAHSKQIIKSQITELIRAERIKTTPAKAKVVQRAFDRLVTHAKKGNEKYVMAFFANNQKAVERLNIVIDKYLGDRTSGYTRRIKTTPRPGDNAPQAYLMLVNTEVEDKQSQLQKVLKKQGSKKNNKKEDKK